MGKYYLGLDGGSTYLKAAFLKDGQIINTVVLPTGIDNSTTAKKIVAALCKNYGISRNDIGYIMPMMIFLKLQPMPMEYV